MRNLFHNPNHLKGWHGLKVLFMNERVNLVNAASEDGDNDYNSDGLDKSFIIQNELDLVPYYWGARTSQNIFVG